MQRLSLAGLSVVAVLTAGAPVTRAEGESAPAERGPKGPAQAHVDRALAHFEAKEYEAAAQAFRHAYQLENRTDFLYAWAQSERLSGHCDAAVPLYERFLAGNPPAVNAEVARINLMRCRQTPTPTAAPGPPPPPPQAAVAAAPPPSPWYRDVGGAAMAGAGVTLLGGAAGFAWAADRSGEARKTATTYDVFDAHTAAQTRWRRLGVGALVAGSALLVGAAIRYWWVAAR